MSIAERKLRQKEELRTLILGAAWQMVLQDGWSALSLRKISGAIDYSVPVIYDHFENKEAILLEFSRQGFALLKKKLQAAVDRHPDAPGKLQAIADAYWNFAFRNKAYYQLMFGLGVRNSNIEKSIAGCGDFRSLVCGPVNDIIEKSGRKDVNAGLRCFTFWSVLHGLVSIKMLGSAGPPETGNKMVLMDAIAGFVKNLEN